MPADKKRVVNRNLSQPLSKSQVDSFKSKKVKGRKGVTYVVDKTAVIKNPLKKHKQISDKPMYKGHRPSTHLMADDNKLTAWPTLFQDKSGNWHKGTRAEAKRKGEVYTFKTRKQMIDFARKGNWKNK
tara:strand:+ start:443 stop:826 length:384 start_codon:yes stop_codon:yes gene_type:complete